MTPQHNEECKRLLRLMGVPYVDAPCEAEAQCAALARAGLVWAAGSEDMDTLTFRAPVLLRHLTFSEAKKMPILEIHLDAALEGLGLTYEAFTDLCILLGCDYLPSIRGIGPKRAVELMREHGSLEAVLRHLDPAKFPVPEAWPFAQARVLFRTPDVHAPETLSEQVRWGVPDEEGLVEFLVREKNFSEDRVRKSIAKLSKAGRSAVQGRLDGFFKAQPSPPQPGAGKGAPSAAKKARVADGTKKASAGRGRGRAR